MVAEKHGGGRFREPMLGEKSNKTELRQETRLGKARDSFQNIAEKVRFAVGVAQER